MYFLERSSSAGQVPVSMISDQDSDELCGHENKVSS